MLISEKYNFIFIHLPKNAGTSIESALLPYTVDGISGRIIRQLNGRKRNYFNSVLRKIFPKTNPQRYSIHISPRELVKILGYDTFKSYFSFIIVRNPWDKLVSEYKYALKSKSHYNHTLVKKLSGFDEFVELRCIKRKGVRSQKTYMSSEDGEILIDYIGRFENLDKDFGIICSKIGIKTSLPRLNISNKKSYIDYYNSETRNLVRETYREDIEFFNYNFK